MRHHSRQLRFVDLFHIHHMEVVRPLVAGSPLREPRPQALHVLHDRVRVRQHGHLLHDLGGVLFAQLYFVILGKDVEPARGIDARFKTGRDEQANDQRQSKHSRVG